MKKYFAHETAVIDPNSSIGEDTKVWHFSHIMKNATLGKGCNVGQGLPTFRSLLIEGEDIGFSKGFTDLHTVSYQKILIGEGYGLDDARNSIEIVSEIRKN